MSPPARTKTQPACAGDLRTRRAAGDGADGLVPADTARSRAPAPPQLA